MRVLSLVAISAAAVSAGRFGAIGRASPAMLDEIKAACAPELAQCGYTEDMAMADLPSVLRCMKNAVKSDTCTAALPARDQETVAGKRTEKLEAIKEACTSELAACGYEEGMEPAELWEVMKCVKTSELSDVCEAAIPFKGRGGGKKGEKLEAIKELCDEELAACGFVEGMARQELIPVFTCMKSSDLSQVCAAAMPGMNAAGKAQKMEALKASCADELDACGFVEGTTGADLKPVWQCLRQSEVSEECASAIPQGKGNGRPNGKFGGGKFGNGGRGNKFGRGGRGGKFGGQTTDNTQTTQGTQTTQNKAAGLNRRNRGFRG